MRIKISIWVVAASILFAQCTKNFESINTDPNQQSPANFNAEYFLASSQNEYRGAISGYESGFLFQSGWAQIVSAAATGYLANMDKYVESANTNDYASRAWNDCYRAAGYADAIIQKHKDDADKVNLVSAATVMKVLSLHYITDIYGDIPYTEALQASGYAVGYTGKGWAPGQLRPRLSPVAGLPDRSGQPERRRAQICSGATSTVRPSSAGFNTIWQLKRLVGRRSRTQPSMPSSWASGAGSLSTHFGST